MLRSIWVLLLLCLPLTVQAGHHAHHNNAVQITVGDAELPSEARDTLRLIRQGGPFHYPRDGVVFGNYERRLPLHPRGYYHEYTVKTPGARNRGSMRAMASR